MLSEEAHIFAVGERVDKYLSDRSFSRGVAKVTHYSKVMHYSPQAVAHRKRAIAGHEEEFQQFRRSLSLEKVLGTAKAVMMEALPTPFRDAALARLTPLHLFESDLQLIFRYKLAFEATVASRTTTVR